MPILPHVIIAKFLDKVILKRYFGRFGVNLRHRWFYGALARGILLACLLSVAGCANGGELPPPPPPNPAWTDRGFSPVDAPPWIDAGFKPQDANSWRDSGFTAQQAGAWHRIVPSPRTARIWIAAGFTKPETVAGWLEVFVRHSCGLLPERCSSEAARLEKAHITPADYKQYTAAGSTNSVDLILKAKALLSEAGTIPEAVRYSSENVQPGGLAAFKQLQKAQSDKLQEAAKPCQTVAHIEALLKASPSTIEGKCFDLLPLNVVQWIDKDAVLATAPRMFNAPNKIFYVEGNDLSQSSIPGALMIGEDPFNFVTDAGVSRIAYHLRILAWASAPALTNPTDDPARSRAKHIVKR